MHAIGIHCAILKDRRAHQATDHLQGLFFLEYANPKSMADQLSRWIENQVTEAKMAAPKVTNAAELIFNEREGLQQELTAHQRNLNKLKEQAALYAAGETPLHLLNQIEAEEETILDLQQKLADLSKL